MLGFIVTAAVITLSLSAIAYLAGYIERGGGKQSTKLSLLPGDISWQNQSGNVRVYFPITTSIVVSLVLTLLLRLFS